MGASLGVQPADTTLAAGVNYVWPDVRKGAPKGYKARGKASMKKDLRELVDRLWRGEAAMQEWNAAISGGSIDEITNDVICISETKILGNVTAIRTGEGLVLVDAGSRETAEIVLKAIRTWDESPIHTVIYTHGHIDHTWGARLLDQEADANGRPRPRIVAHRGVTERFRRYDTTRGLNTNINGRQFNKVGYEFPSDHRYPDETYDDSRDLTVGGVCFRLVHGRGETDDATFVWVAAKRILISGDFVVWAFPNAGNPQKVQRFAPDWVEALREMSKFGAETLVPGHGPVVIGAARVAEMLGGAADLLDSIVGQTRNMMNDGRKLNDIVHNVQVPERLITKPYLLPSYDDPEFVVRNIWRLYGGWYDGNPAQLKPAPDVEVAREIAALAGGPRTLASRAEALGEEGRLRVATHLVELAAHAAPKDTTVHRLRALIYQKRAAGESSLLAKGIFASAQRESEGLAKT
jgi:alkyl sulfatase BDS1-like metallo-beta-lactamase superfamily hydrolase